MITKITDEVINCALKVSPYILGVAVSFKIEEILLKMIVTTVTLLFAQIVVHYLKPILIKKIDRFKKKK